MDWERAAGHASSGVSLANQKPAFGGPGRSLGQHAEGELVCL